MASPGDDVQLHPLSPPPIEPSSPARDALKGNLKVADNDLSLKKKKSWFGSMRDVFHKSALQAKAAVDSMRGEDKVKSADETKPMIESPRCPGYFDTTTPEPRESLDSAASTTPLKSHTSSPQLTRRRTFSPRYAASSLRKHLHGHGSRSKRGSVHTIAGRLSNDGSEIPSPEHFANLDSVDEVEQRRRKNSMAGSLVGSIRGLTRRGTTKSRATTSLETNRPDEVPNEVPLPSSPINIIPSAAPVLGLDLGQPGMNFLPAEMHQRDEDTLKLQDPANFTLAGSGRPQSSLPFVPDELKINHTFTHPAVRQRPATPSEMLLRLPPSHSPFELPATPLPGASQGMNFSDGANDSASSGKKSQVFERSVTPTTGKERKELRTMCSLDAIADAYKTARKDSVEACETVDEEGRSQPSPDPDASPLSNPFDSRNVVPSISTLASCPADMESLERQKSANSTYYKFGFDAEARRDWIAAPVPVDDPFDDSHAAGSGPPSPEKSVKLPFRLKVKPASDESAASVELGRGSPGGAVEQGDLVTNDQHTTSGQTSDAVLPKYEVDVQQYLQRSHAVPQDLAHIEQRSHTPTSAEHTEVTSDDDTMNRAQNLWNSDSVYPIDEYLEEGSEDGVSPHGGPMVPAALWHRDVSPTGSPGKSTWKAGLGEGGFKFSFDTWRPGPQPTPDPQPQSTPDRRAMDPSIDSVSVDDETWETPMGSRASHKSDRTPSMGNKLEFELKRSERNMRYNALQQEQAQQDQQKNSSSPARMQARFILGGSSGEMDPNEAQYFPDYSTAYIDTPEGPIEDDYLPTRVASEDSITMSLRSASDNMEKLRALLGDIDSDGETVRHEEIIDAFTTASSPRSKYPVGRKDRDIRSDSPSPEKRPSRPLPSTPKVAPLKFSPTSARDNASPNRFTVLDTEADIASSPPEGGPSGLIHLPLVYDLQAKENRIGSGDTLDQTLDMLSSPASGYKADDSSETQTPETVKQLPKRYRSRSNRPGRKVLGQVSENNA